MECIHRMANLTSAKVFVFGFLLAEVRDLVKTPQTTDWSENRLKHVTGHSASPWFPPCRK